MFKIILLHKIVGGIFAPHVTLTTCCIIDLVNRLVEIKHKKIMTLGPHVL